MSKLSGKVVKPVLLLFLFVLWLVVSIVQSCHRNSPGDEFTGQDPSSALYIDQNFLGSESCKSCHEKEYEEWYLSHHARAMAEANDSTVLGDFDSVRFNSKGITSTFFRKEEKYFVNTIGGDGTMRDFEVIYTFGIKPLQQYLVRFPNGRFQTLHLSWDSEKNEWFEQYPKDTFPHWDWMHWTKGAMTWNNMCADCHSTNLEKNYSVENDSYETTWSIINVSCEACHGPGKQHVEYVNSRAYDSTDVVKGSYLKLTNDVTPIEQVEQCAPCHSRRSMVSGKYDMTGRFLDHFVPDILRIELYYADGQIKEEDYVYGSFVQSKMFQNGVKCTNCHNAHTGNLLLAGNALCTQCHSKDKYDSPDHHYHPENSESSSCINCHMTGEYYMVNDYRRDHSFRIPRPDHSIDYDVPNACNQCHTDKSATWAAEAIRKWYGPQRKENYTDMLVKGFDVPDELVKLASDNTEPAIARATAIHRMSVFQGENVIQTSVNGLSDVDARVRITAINSLANQPLNERVRLISPLLNDPIRSVRIAAVSALTEADPENIPISFQDAFLQASKEHMISLKQNEDFSMGQFQIGQYHDLKGNDSLAITAYRRALQIDSLNGAPRINLARVYNRVGKNDMAIKTLQDHILLEPESVEGYYYLGLVHAEENNVGSAVSAFEKAIDLEPLNQRFYYNLGLLLQQNGQSEEAVSVFKEGLDTVPDADDVRYALATTYYENGQHKLALKEAQILLDRYPQNQNIQQLVNILKRSEGDKQAQ